MEAAQTDAPSDGKAARAMREARDDVQSIHSNDAKISDCDVQKGGCHQNCNDGLKDEWCFCNAGYKISSSDWKICEGET
jgi:hypothetical protein